MQLKEPRLFFLVLLMADLSQLSPGTKEMTQLVSYSIKEETGHFKLNLMMQDGIAVLQRIFVNPFKPVNASFQLIVGKFCWVLFLLFSGNNIAIELSL